MKYKTLEAFMAADLKVGDKLITEDIDGKAIFQVADIRKRYIYMIRKFALKDRYPMRRDDFDLIDWLNSEYQCSMPLDLINLMVARKKDKIFLPREVEVFGEYEWSSKEEKGKQWKLFKKTKQRIRLIGDSKGSACGWWECSPYVGASPTFCLVDTSGAAYGNFASYARGVAPCFRIAR